MTGDGIVKNVIIHLLRTINRTTTITMTMTSTILRLCSEALITALTLTACVFSSFSFGKTPQGLGRVHRRLRLDADGLVQRYASWYAVIRLGPSFGSGRGPGSLKQQYHHHPRTLSKQDWQGLAAIAWQKMTIAPCAS